MQQRKKYFLRTTLILFVVLILPHWVGAQSNQVQSIIVTQVDESAFPDITVQVRVLNEDGVPVTNLNRADLQLLENDVVMALRQGPALEEGPVWAHLVIDGGLRLSQASRWPRIQESIGQMVRQHMLPDDRVALSVVERNSVVSLTPFTRNAGDITAALDRYQPTCFDTECASAPLPPLRTILNDLSQVEDGANPQFIIFFTGELERYDAQEVTQLANSARDLDIPIYTVLVSGTGAVEQVERLGTNSGGGSLRYEDGDSVNVFYQAITGRLRPQYRITYRSANGVASERQVRVTTADGRASGEGRYVIEQIDLPRVRIDRPEENALIASRSGQESIVVTVIFTDNHTRELQSVSLEINGDSVPVTPDNLNPNRVEIPFPWDYLQNTVHDLEAEAVQISLAIEVTDEFNLTSRPVRQLVRIATSVLAEPEPTETPVTSDLALPPVPGPDPDNGFNIVMVISVTGLAAAMIFLILTRDKGPAKAIRHTISKQIDRVTKRIVRQSTPRAYLIVLDGDANVGKSLELYGTTTVGRSKQDSELLFQQHDETSPISRRHCTILDEEDHFQIRDEDSANGTYLNGVRLDSMVPRELQDGDEIELARVERGGVKLQFQAVLPVLDAYQYEDEQGFGPPRQTRAVRRPQQRGDRF